MLYLDGEQFGYAYLTGESVSFVYSNGECIYPGTILSDEIAMFISGKIFNGVPLYDVRNCIAIIRSETPPPADIVSYTISDPNYTHGPDNTISAWIVSGADSILYWYCESINVFANQYFSVGDGPYRRTITNISGLEHIDMSRTENLSWCLYSFRNLSDLYAISNWDTSHVTDFMYCICDCGVTDLSALSGWDTSSGREFYGMFADCPNLLDISDIGSWDMHNAESLRYMFSRIPATSIPVLSWDISAVSSIDDMFSGCNYLTDVSGLADWDVSGISSMYGVFLRCQNLSDISPLAHWNPSRDCNLGFMFSGTSVSDISPTYSWDITGGYGMFAETEITAFDFNCYYNVSANSVDFSYVTRGCKKLLICDLGDKVKRLFPVDLFTGCTVLHTLIIRNTSMVPFLTSSQINTAFADCPVMKSSAGKLYVPQALIAEYTADLRWYSALLRYGCQVLPIEGSPYE